MCPSDETPRVAPPIDIGRGWRRLPGRTRAIRWLFVVALAPATIWVAGRGVDRLWFGPESLTTAPQSTATVRQKLEQKYRTLFEELSAAAQIAARRPDLVRTTQDPASGRALFALAASAAGRLRESDLRAALTIYDHAGQPVGWAGHPSDRLDVPSPPPGFRVVGGPFDFRLVHVAAVIDGGTRVGTVAAERVLGSGGRIRNRYLENFDFTVTAAGLPLEVTYFTSQTDHRTVAERSSFVIRDPSGQPVAAVTVLPSALIPEREYVRGIVRTVATAVGLVGLVGLALALARAPEVSRISRLLVVVVVIWLLRLVMLWTKFPATTPWLPSLNPRQQAAAQIGGLLRSPADFALTAGAVLVTALAAGVAFDWLRRTFRSRRLPLGGSIRGFALYSLIQLTTALLAVAMLIGYHQFIAVTVTNSRIDLLHVSLHPWSVGSLALQIGFVAFHAAAALFLVLVFRLGLFIARRPVSRQSWLPAQLAFWTTAVIAAQLLILRRVDVPFWPSIAVYSVAALSSYYAERLTARIRGRAVSIRLATIFAAVLLPSLLFSVSTSYYLETHTRRLVETQAAQEVLRHRENHMSALQQALSQIDALDVAAQVSTAQRAGSPQDMAFRLWIRTDLAALRLTSAIEIYEESGALLSRFALNLPSYRQPQFLPTADARWHVTEEAVPRASMRQQVVSGSRSVHTDGRRVSTITVRVAHDYDTLQFISSHNPYFELFRSPTSERLDGTITADIDLAVYDWQRRPVYASTRSAWNLDEDLRQRIQQGAGPFWTVVSRDAVRDDAFVFWDAEQIYVLGYPHKSARRYVVDAADVVLLVGAMGLACLVVLTLAAWAVGRQEIWPMRLPREVRSSFHGKLLLAFVAAATVPMVILSLSVHAEFEAHVRAEEEAEARTHVTVARRVVEDYEASRPTALVDDDDVMVWIRSLVEQDVTVFAAGRLLATSQRDLFAAGLLPPLAPAPAYQRIALDRADQYVGREQIGSFGYMMVAARVRFDGQDAILTVPLALRQREIDRKMDELDRGLLLLTLLFVLGAATLGYWTAERLAAPIGRLTRATGRLARGDFQPLPVTAPADEIQRLVSAFNRMASDLEAQRARLEQTTRLEASADMARRVAHDIKNPLTPVQLSAEHLLRVVADEGQAPRAVVERCAENILRQVRTLRQIASEFSTFGTAPVPTPEPWDVLALLEEIALSYQSGVDRRVELVATAAPDLSPAFADRVLVARALTNLVENALHAIPERGRIVLRGRSGGDRRIAIDVSDSGGGIAQEVLPRIFEPYFSTRTGGTGLGMSIVKRNIEANGGVVEVTSTPGTGTCVTVVLPAASKS